jgi:V8-like Glu-specific endopeptidase
MPTKKAPTLARPSPKATSLGEGQPSFGEVEGDPVVTMPAVIGTESSASGHEEVGADAAESGEEYIEATPEQLSAAGAESGEESALSDLRGIEGYQDPSPMGEGAPISDAGSAGEGGEEFLPILGALVPTLVSTVGPALAKAVASKLKPATKTKLAAIANKAKPVVAAVASKVAPKVPTGISSLLPILAKLLQSALAKGGGESAGEEGAVDEVLAAEAAAAMEVIIGIDQRIQITNTTDIPWRRICALRIQFPSGATYRGTAFFIGPRALATAGHCVYMKSQGGWARKIEVIPGCNGSKRPFGQADATMFRSVGGWVNNGLPECDYGCIFLPSNSFGKYNLGSFGVAAFDASTLVAQPAVVAGYPGDKPFAELWGMAEVIKAVTAKTLVYNIDTVGGQSGCPVYIKRGGQRYVVGIHNYGAATGNSATRITTPVYERLNAWKNL